MPGEHVVHTEETAEGLHVHGADDPSAATSSESGPAGSEPSGTGPSGTGQEPLD
jgi:hypothetical protein